MNVPLLYGIPRSGGTVIYNIVNYLYSGLCRPQVHHYIDAYGATMNTNSRDKNFGTLSPITSSQRPTIVTYRDFRDACISQWRAYYAGFDEEKDKTYIPLDALKEIADGELLVVKTLNLFKKDADNGRSVLFLKYEDFFDSTAGDLKFEFIFQELSNYLDIEITQEQKDHIRKTYCFKNQKKLSKQYKDFHEFDEKTHLHGHHLYKGKTGTWRELVRPEHHNIMNSVLMRSLIEWGYE